jgi:pimeloyl-ACP methyl ester carboxylesterase
MNETLKLHFESHGSGPPIVMIHGIGANICTWKPLVEPFARTNKLFLIDLKGFGKSPKPKDNRYSVQDQADLIHQFIIQQDLRGLTLVGHSMGGAVALFVALRLMKEKSDRLSALVVVDGAAYRQKLPLFIAILRLPIIRSVVFFLLSDKANTRLILKKSYFDDTKITKEQIKAYAEPLGMPGGKYALVSTAEKIIPSNIDQITQEYPNITIPTLIIWGRQDEIVPLSVGETLHQAIRQSEFEVIDECGHIPSEEKPDETIKILQRFLEKPRITQI